MLQHQPRGVQQAAAAIGQDPGQAGTQQVLQREVLAIPEPLQQPQLGAAGSVDHGVPLGPREAGPASGRCGTHLLGRELRRRRLSVGA